jgi:hypothetical protein
MKLRANQSAAVSVTFKNAEGFPTDVQGEVMWSSSNSNVTVVADEHDSTKATITAGPTAATATVTATADADLGTGVDNVSATLPVEVIARDEAIGGEIDVVTKDQGLPPHPAPKPGVDNELPASGAKPK